MRPVTSETKLEKNASRGRVRMLPLRSPLRGLALGLLLLLVSVSPMGMAATITVTSSADSGAGSLRDAIAAAAPGDTIAFAVPAVNLTTADLSINKNLTIDGGSGGVTIARQTGSPNFRIFSVGGGANVALNRLTITGGKLGNPSVTSLGAGVFNAGSLTITDSTVTGNFCDGFGVVGCGICNFGGTLKVVNSTVSSNTGASPGNNLGVGIADYNGLLVVTNSTVTGNSALSAASFGGGVYITGGITVAGNTVIAGNTSPIGPDVYGQVTSAGYNLIGNTGSASIVGATTGNVLNTNALLASLANYGGPTATHALLPGSPAINAGAAPSEVQLVMIGGSAGTFTLTFNGQTTGALAYNATAAAVQAALTALSSVGPGNLVVSGGAANYVLIFQGALAGSNQPQSTGAGVGGATVNVQTLADGGALGADQRNIARPQQGTPDIGAFESRGFTIAVSGGNNQSAAVNTAFGAPLSVAAANTFGEPVDGGRVTFTPPGSGASCTVAGNPATIAGGTATSGMVTANGIAGGPFNVSAAVQGASSVNFSLTVLQGPTTTAITNAASLASTPTVVGQSYAVNVSVSGTGTPTGTVTVSDGTGATCNITLSAGSGNCNLTSTSAGAKTITATYGGSANYLGSSTTASHTVNQASTTTSITNVGALVSTPTVVGQSYAVNWSVTVNSPGSGTPTGNVTVNDSTGGTCTAPVSAGTCNLVSTTAGFKTISASYTGDINYGASATAGASHTVNKADTTTTITNAAALASPTLVGQSYAVNWSVTVNAPGAVGAALTGNVTVSDGTDSCTAAVSAGTCNLTSTTLGAKTITATYAGDANYNGSTSSGVPHTVNKADTTTTITNASSLNSTPTVVGQSYAVNVSVTVNLPGTGTPTGTVTVSDGTGATCGVTLSGGTGSCNLTSTSASAKTITAAYGGDANVNSSTGTASHTVSKASTTLGGLTDSPDPSVVGQSYAVGFVLSVNSPGGGTPTGTVTVDDGAGGTCTATLPATSCSLTSTVAGNKTVTFTYNGDSNYNGSSNTAGHAVNKANTTVAITNDAPDPSVIGQNYAVTAGVTVTSPGSGTPTGTITVTDGTNSCLITLPATSCNLPSTSVGAKTLTATYSGDTNFNGSGPSAGVPHTVNKADATTTITSDNPDSSAVGQNVTVAFTVAAAAPGVGTPTGNVTVTVSGGAETCTGTLAAGAGSCTLALTTPGPRTLTATYAGDTSFNGSTSVGEPHTVVAPPTIAKSFTPATVLLNQPSTLTITMTNPGTNPTGLTGIGVTDAFPAGLAVAATPSATNTCGGTFGPAAGATTITLSGGAIAAPGASCAVSVAVVATTTGTKTNITGNVTSTEGGTGGTATAVLTVVPPPTAVVSGTATICAGQSTTITAVLTGATPWTVTWSDGVVQNVTASPATRTVSPTFNTTYTVTSLTDANYSSITTGLTGSAVITVKPTPSSVITSASSVCSNSIGNAASVPDAGPGATYLWGVAGGTATSALNGRSITYTAGASGNVTLTVTVTLNGCPSTGTKVVPIDVVPTAPVPTAPANGGTYQGSHVSWTHAGNAVYDVTFDTVNPPQRILAKGLVNNFEAAIPVWFPGVTYYWQVVARNACGQTASAVQTFTAGSCAWSGQAPVLIAPIANATNQNTATTLQWTSVPGAARYDIYLGTTSTNVTLYRTIPSPQLSTTVRLAGGKTYFWKVVATPVCGASGAASSATQSFTTAGNGFTLTAVTPGFVNRWQSGQELSVTGGGFLATSRVFTEYQENPVGTLTPSIFTNSFSTSTNLFETLTPEAEAPAARYDVGVTDAGIEEGRLLQSLALRVFTDVTEADWYFESSGRIADAGVMESDIDPAASGPQFWPNATVTRAQMAEYLSKAYQWWRTRSTALPAATCTAPDFPDVPCSHPNWLAIHWIKAWGVTIGAPCATGGGNCFYPDNNVSRAEMVTFLERLRQGAILPSLLGTVGQTDPGCGVAYPGCVGWADLPSAGAIQWPRAEMNVAYADRLTAGCGGTLGNLHACPSDLVTRAQIGAFLARLVGLVPTP